MTQTELSKNEDFTALWFTEQRKDDQCMDTPKWKSKFDLVEMQRGKSAGLSGTNIKTNFAQTNEVSFNSHNRSPLEDHLFPQSISFLPPLGIAQDPVAKYNVLCPK